MDEREQGMTTYGDCTFCGGIVKEKRVDYDYRRQERLLVIRNVPVGVCCQCSEKYFKPQVVKKMDEAYQAIFDHHEQPESILQIPAVSF
jgi:YgiT-type zinc finger domain-containing protein